MGTHSDPPTRFLKLIQFQAIVVIPVALPLYNVDIYISKYSFDSCGGSVEAKLIQDVSPVQLATVSNKIDFVEWWQNRHGYKDRRNK